MTIDTDALAAWLDLAVEIASSKTDAFEARAEAQQNLAASWDGKMRGYQASRLNGVGVRVWVEGADGYASCHDPTRRGLQAMVDRALRVAASNARAGQGSFPYHPDGSASTVYEPSLDQDPATADPEAVVPLMRRAYDAAREEDPDAFARSSFSSMTRRVLFADGAGRRATNRFTLSTLQCQAVHRGGDRLGEGTDWQGGERGLGDFEDGGGPEAVGVRAAERAEEASRAKPVPAGHQRVLCDNVLSGLLAHESFGHLTEYDLVDLDWSLLAGRRGERFADPCVTITDAPEVPGAPQEGIRMPYDDEGTRGATVRLLEEGVLARWMHQRGSAAASKDAPTGNGRALNVRYPPIVRMRNTFFEPGEHSFEEALEALGDGLYLIEGRGGAPASDGSFTFTAARGYRVEGGKIQEPLRSTTISGNILDFLAGVEAVTDDFEVTTTNYGGCGKWAQSYIPVGMGGPHVLVGDALVGGARG